MTAYTLNLPEQLKHEIEQLVQSQGISLDQFILWAVTEKVSTLKASFSQIAYRQGANGQLVPIIKGTGIRVQTVVIASQKWGMSLSQIADEYELNEAQVREALSFYVVNKEQIDTAISSEQSLESANG
ncbi:MAG: DUF433 domain-containing protein [Sphaerospermopsis kisseleviana]|uniref:DUF433 domain-containing protein n=1 Tax=Sphaerospermopsis aphanizomenoides LEGE 00250 TaxID=2777972 RepID=A0ABR9VIM8_9CYAN|nr:MULTISPECIES: DUF433 domain-containing protein [Sphaerospermopsis]MBD2131658.1 DUF433 domain-containing protein [Sphaerospermopsis sp. FACHB-1094]MBD2148029.1 DUF433 domain-containing protein [Sphaerospermopsis sp. FACHB-1194]MBE9237527.1 DUF433 domain-containing protein [Sphaerospermopsis aphanizomenoides LEGE 00250]